MEEHLIIMCEALSSIPMTSTKEKNFFPKQKSKNTDIILVSS